MANLLGGRLGVLFAKYSHLFARPSHELNDFVVSGDTPAARERSGPQFPTAGTVPMAAAGVGAQKGPFSSKNAFAPLIDASTKEEHMRKALTLEHPFATPPVLEHDVMYAIHKTVSLGARIRPWRQDRLRQLAAVHSSLAAFDAEARDLMHSDVWCIHALHSPGFILFMVLLLGWPCLDVARHEITGHKVIGKLPFSGTYTAVEAEPVLSMEEFMAGAEAASLRLQDEIKPTNQAAPPWKMVGLDSTDDEVWRQTQEDIDRNEAEECSFDALNAQYGVGGWRALPRFGLWQRHNGKLRNLDDGKRGRHNAATAPQEKLHCVTVDWPVAVARAMFLTMSPCARVVEKLEGGTEDWKRGYRQRARHPQHARYSIVAVWKPSIQKVVFVKYRTLLFGLVSAVIAFNCSPALVTAFLRRVLAVITAHYFDDQKILDLGSARGSGQLSVKAVYDFCGFKLDAEKEQRMNVVSTYLGVKYDYSGTFSGGVVHIDSKEGRRDSIALEVNNIFDEDSLAPARAGKLRGRTQHFSGQIFGRVGRAPEHALAQQQYGNTTELSEYLVAALLLLLAIVQFVPGRDIYMQPRYSAPTIIYSDASYSDHEGCKLGLVIFSPKLVRPVGIASFIPQSTLQAFGVRGTYITQGEAFVCLLGPEHVPDAFVDVDIIWFLDNVGAECAFVKGYSRDTSLATITSIMHIMLAGLRCRVWWEHVSSENNISDGLSRAGTRDEWTSCQPWDLRSVSPPEWDAEAGAPLRSLLRVYAAKAERTRLALRPCTPSAADMLAARGS